MASAASHRACHLRLHGFQDSTPRALVCPRHIRHIRSSVSKKGHSVSGLALKSLSLLLESAPIVTEPGPLRESQRVIISDFEHAITTNARIPIPPPLEPQLPQALEALQTQGFVHLTQILSHETCDALWEHVQDAVNTAASGAGLLGGAKARVDVKLKLEGAAKLTARETLGTNQLATLLLGAATDDAYLCEFGVLCSLPGANRQPVHPDTVCTGRRAERPIYTCFVALQDVDVHMGPTRLLVGTNTPEAHKIASNVTSDEYASLLANTPNVDATLKKGHAVVFDSRTLHAGGANEANEGRRRCLLYLSAQGPEEGCTKLPTSPERRTPPNAYSIVPEYHNKLKVREWNVFTA